MKTTDKHSCRVIAGLLAAHGVKDVVISPGSRNAPLIIAVKRHPELDVHLIIDERSAAFFGLGLALQTGRPVAIICTSGSAVMNYGPALSEAFYRRIPLIAITADRPPEWIDQDDSQTIRQNGALDNIVKGSFDIGVDNDMKPSRIFTSRTVNDAIILSCRAPQGPVHINVRLDEPLGELSENFNDDLHFIDLAENNEAQLSKDCATALAHHIAEKRTMVIAGFNNPSGALDNSLADFLRISGAILLHEAESNISVSPSVSNIDATLSVIGDEELAEMAPELVITFGGSIVSRKIKKYLRSVDSLEHWHIGYNPNSIDCFMAMTHRIECSPQVFFKMMSRRLPSSVHGNHKFASDWIHKSAEARQKSHNYLKSSPWSDFYAIGRLLQLVPRSWNLHFSNGTSIRYAQLFDYSAFRRIDCNRGVSGIDGSTSTAIGAHCRYDDVTLLVSGDMSAQYDVGALGITEITPRFKMAVLNNSGGGIFRFISSTSSLEECEECFAADVRLPLRQLAEGYGFAYFEAFDKPSFETAFCRFVAEHERPAIFNIITSGAESAEILKQFFNQQ